MLFLGIETGMILALSVLEFGIYGGVAGAGLLMPQYLVYIPAYFLSCRYRIQTIVWDLEKLWTCAAENRGLFLAGDHSFSAVYRRNPRRKFSESLDRRKSYKGPEIFLRKISTISSNGFHKICDIWWFAPESVENVRFYAEKLFDFM